MRRWAIIAAAVRRDCRRRCRRRCVLLTHDTSGHHRGAVAMTARSRSGVRIAAPAAHGDVPTTARTRRRTRSRSDVPRDRRPHSTERPVSELVRLRARTSPDRSAGSRATALPRRDARGTRTCTGASAAVPAHPLVVTLRRRVPQPVRARLRRSSRGRGWPGVLDLEVRNTERSGGCRRSRSGLIGDGWELAAQR